MSVDWTPAQVRIARVAGTCPSCREPLMVRIGSVQPAMLELVCPRGHDPFAPQPSTQDPKNPPRLH